MTSLSDAALNHLREVVDAPDLTGTRYEMVRPLGKGGMGTVYLVRDTKLGRTVALKTLGAHATGGSLGARLDQEATILAGLEHPGIVPVHDVGVLADGRLYYTMKFVRGDRLDHHLQNALSLAAKLQLFERICDAVAFAHAQGVIHRDLKPQNVMVGEFGEVLVVDWGVAKLRAEHDAAGTVIGTTGYMAPEQAAGVVADERADIHALGAILSFMLAGDTGAPKPLRAIAARAAAVLPEDRYQSVGALAEDVARFRDGRPVEAYRENILERGQRLAVRYRLPIALVVAYVFMRALLLLLPG